MRDFLLKYDDEIHIFLFVLCIAALIFVIVRGNRRDRQALGEMEKITLRAAVPRPAPEKAVKELKQTKVFKVTLGLFLSQLVWHGDLAAIFLKLLVLVGGIAAWILYDDYRLSRPEDKVIVPAYVQDTYGVRSRWGGNVTQSAQLIYYDYKADQFRMLSSPIDELQRKQGLVCKGTQVEIIAVEKSYRIKLLAVYADGQVDHTYEKDELTKKLREVLEVRNERIR